MGRDDWILQRPHKNRPSRENVRNHGQKLLEAWKIKTKL
jgi:hypothetical protein